MAENWETNYTLNSDLRVECCRESTCINLEAIKIFSGKRTCYISKQFKDKSNRKYKELDCDVVILARC